MYRIVIVATIMATAARAQEQPLTAKVRQEFVGLHSAVPTPDQPTRLAISSRDGTTYGVGSDTGRVEPSDSALYDELARMDSLLFDATYVRCDTVATFALLTDDVEFYHDRTGFHQGPQVRADFARLAESCPRTLGITRRLVPNTLRVYPISGYGAVQVGVHEFVERGARTATTARFVHVWRKTDAGWRISRVLSLDHHITDVP